MAADAPEEPPQDALASRPHVAPPSPGYVPSVPLRGGAPSRPMFVPVPNVLQCKEEENAQRRAEKEAEVREQMLLQQSGGQDLACPAPPLARPPAPTPNATIAPPPAALNAPPASALDAAPSAHARTRVLGFNAAAAATSNPLAGPVVATEMQCFPTGWVVVIEGPGTGHFFPLFSGVSSIGRDTGQSIALTFGDTTISRENHAAIAYDEEDNAFYVGHGGKSNIIRLNGRPVLSTETLSHGDTLRIGETTMRMVALCGAEFNWADQNNG